MRIRRKTWLVGSTLAVLVIFPFIGTGIFLVVRMLSNAQSPLFIDFANYYYAAERFLQGCSLYSPSISKCPPSFDIGQITVRYVYPPITLFLFVPFTYLPYLLAALIWNLIGIIFLWSGILALINTQDTELTIIERIVLLWCTIGFAPVLGVLLLGQVTGFLVAGICWAGAFILADNGEDTITSDIIIIFAVIVKPFYISIIVPLFRNSERVISGFLIGLVSYISGIIIFGFTTHIEYISSIFLEGGSRRLASRSIIEWQPVAFRPFYVFGDFEFEIHVLVLLTILLISMFSYLVCEPDMINPYVFSFGLLGVALAPGANTYTLSILVPVYILMFLRERNNSDHIITLLLFSIILVQAHPYTIRLVSTFGPRHISSHMITLRPLLPWIQPALWGTLLLFALVFYRWLKLISLARTCPRIRLPS